MLKKINYLVVTFCFCFLLSTVLFLKNHPECETRFKTSPRFWIKKEVDRCVCVRSFPLSLLIGWQAYDTSDRALALHPDQLTAFLCHSEDVWLLLVGPALNSPTPQTPRTPWTPQTLQKKQQVSLWADVMMTSSSLSWAPVSAWD